MFEKLGFIGCGNMATAIINGAVSKGFVKGENVFVFDVDGAKTSALKEKYGLNICDSAEMVAQSTSVTVLAVKPQVFPTVLPQIKASVEKNNTAIVSIGAGKTLEYIGSFLSEDTPIVRVMPNINAKVGASMSGVCRNKNATDELLEYVKSLCEAFGNVIELDESMFPLFGVIAGCSPAYSFMFIDSMAREAVKNGMKKDEALKICAQAVLGSAKMTAQQTMHLNL
jgi:pyrroline-5-carboxylate reductase